MPVTHEIWLKTDLKRPITVQPLRGLLFSADNQGDKVGFEVYEDGTPVTLSGVITGYIIKNNGETVVVSGSFEGNRAWITCPANAYDAVGPIYIAIKNRASTATNAVTTTLGMCTTYVERTATGEIVTPTYKIVDAATIANMITQMETATNAANTAATNANNKASAANTAATSANNAASTANTAATNANTAKDNANAAADAANAAAAAAPTQITNQATAYQNSTSGTTIPTGTWLDTQPTTPQGQFLWIRKTLTWDNGETTTLYSVSRMGMDGSGSVSSVNNISPDSSGNVALPIDSTPTAGSTNPVTSGGAYTALAGKINKSGDTMSGTLIMANNSGPRNSTSPQIGFYFDGNDWVANIQYTSSNKHFCFIERDASDNSIREQFYLPGITSASGAHNYDILTSKNPVTIAQGGTGATTAAAALTNLGAVNKDGDTIAGDLVLTSSGNYPTLRFLRYADEANGPQQMIQTSEGGTTSRLAFYQRVNGSSAWEGYRLPLTTTSLNSGVGYDILTSKPGTGSLYYATGETYSTDTEMVMSGYITNGVRNIQLGLWLPKSLEKISIISITTLVGSMRGISGYINGWSGSTNILTQSGITVTAYRTAPNGIRLSIASSSDLTNATANTPVAFSGKVTLSFS